MIALKMLSPRRFLTLGLLTLLVLTALSALPTPLALAQTAVPATATPAPSRTPAPTPTATPTLTALGARLLLGQTLLKGGDFAGAAKLFSEIAAEECGNPEALAGLKAALDGATAARATAAAPTAAPPKPAPTAAPTFGSTLARQWTDLSSVALAGLALLVIVYFVAKLLRSAVAWLRELWLLRGRVRLGLAPSKPPFIVGQFTDATGIKDLQGEAIVTQALTRKLLEDSAAWVGKLSDIPVEPAPSLELSGMGWIKLLWAWITPPPRGHKISGVLLPPNHAGRYGLAVQRVALADNRVDASTTFEQADGTAPAALAFRQMAETAAQWLRQPRAIEEELERARPVRSAAAGPAELAVPKGPRRGMADPLPAEPPAEPVAQPLDAVLAKLGQARRLAQADPPKTAAARAALSDARAALSAVPAGSALYNDLRSAIAEAERTFGGA